LKGHYTQYSTTIPEGYRHTGTAAGGVADAAYDKAHHRQQGDYRCKILIRDFDGPW